MIYIFDDKKSRQLGFNWTPKRFGKYSNFICPIYQYSDIKDDEQKKKIFKKVQLFYSMNHFLMPSLISMKKNHY